MVTFLKYTEVWWIPWTREDVQRLLASRRMKSSGDRDSSWRQLARKISLGADAGPLNAFVKNLSYQLIFFDRYSLQFNFLTTNSD
jgi:hypothetical protein